MINEKTKSGCLMIVATPIGHLGDMSPRAVMCLQSADCIAAEDTRHSRRLLQHYHIATPLVTLHAHNEAQQTPLLLARLKAGETIAVISDAGTPLVSDPGFELVRAAQQQGISVVSVPGPCAAIAALAASGIPAHQFRFVGFLSAYTSKRERQLTDLASEPETLIFYEAPHRLIATLTAMQEVFGQQRSVTIAKEISKIHETYFHGALETVLARLTQSPTVIKGEFVIVVSGCEVADTSETVTLSVEHVLSDLLAVMPVKSAVTLMQQWTSIGKNQLYDLALRLREQTN